MGKLDKRGRLLACFGGAVGGGGLVFKLGDQGGKGKRPVPLQLLTGTSGPDVLLPGLVMSVLDLQPLSKHLHTPKVGPTHQAGHSVTPGRSHPRISTPDSSYILSSISLWSLHCPCPGGQPPQAP